MPPISDFERYRQEARRRMGLVEADPQDETAPVSFRDIAPSGVNPFMKMLDLINTPQQLIFGGVKGLIEDKPILESAIRGAKEDVRFGEVLETMGMGEGGRLENMPIVGQALEAVEDVPILGGIAEFAGGITGRGALGLLGDLVLDPLLGLGKLSRGTKAADWVMRKGAAVVPRAVGGRLVYEGFEEGYKKSLRLMTPGEETLRTLQSSVDRAQRGRAAVKSREAGEFSVLIKKKARRAKVSPKQVEAAITESIERPLLITVAKSKKLLKQTKEEYIKSVEDQIGKVAARASSDAAVDDIITMANTRGKLAPDDPLREFIYQEAMGLKNQYDNMLFDEQAAFLGTEWLNDTSLDYILHMLTPEAKKALKAIPELAIYGGAKFTGRHASQLARRPDWQGKSVAELNRLAFAGELPGIGQKFRGKLFETDPARLNIVRTIRGLKAESDAKVFLDSARLLGRKAATIDEGADMYKPLAIMRSNKAGLKPLQEELKRQGNLFEPEVARHLDAYWEGISNPLAPSSVTNFFKGFDAAQKEWKLLTLFPFPAYHSRNFIGNFWNNILAGLYPGKGTFGPGGYYSAARKFQRTDMNSSKTFTFGGRTQNKAEWDIEASEFGVTDSFRTLLIGNDPAEVGVEATRALVEKLPVVGSAVRTGLKVGGLIEDNARLAHYFFKLDEGLPRMEAALSVKRYLFNYAELTQFEQSIMRRAFPFYAWTRFNLPLQIRGVIERPEVYGGLGDIIEAVERDVPVPSDTDRILEGWMKENSAVRVRRDDRGNPEFFLLGGWLPAADLNKVMGPSSVLQLALDNLGPLKVLPEMAFNYDIFLKRQIEDPLIPGESTKFLGMTIPKRTVLKPLQQIRMLTEFDRLIAAVQETGVFGETKITNRRGDDLGVAIVRSLFGAKTFPFYRQRRLQELKRRRTMLKRKLRVDRLRNAGVNEARIKQLMKDPTQADT